MTEGSNAIRRRYVPKGGHIVDFEKRTTPKMRYLMRMRGDGQMEGAECLSGEQECGRTCQTDDAKSGCISERAIVVWRGTEHATRRVELNRDVHDSCSTEDHGKVMQAGPVQEQGWTDSIHPGSRKTGINTTSHNLSANKANFQEARLLPRKGQGQDSGMMRLRYGLTEAVSRGQNKHGSHIAGYWKPAGPVRQVMHVHFNKKTMRRRTGKALYRGIDNRQSAHDCESCLCCSTLRNQLNEQIEENRLISEALKSKKTTLASSISKLAREKREFEIFKEQQTNELRKRQEESKRKTERDRLARASEARYASKDTEAKLRMNLSKVQGELGLIKEKLTGEVKKYKQEADRIFQQKKSLEAQVKELKMLLAEAKIHLSAPCPEPPSPGGHAIRENRQDDLTTPKRGICPPKKGLHQRDQEDSLPGETHSQDVSKTKYENGTEKTAWQGYACYEYTNGDIRQEYPSGGVEYFYNSLGCWHIAHTSGEDVYYFEDGRREAHLKNDVIQISLQGNPNAYSCANGSSELHLIPLSDVNALLLCPCPRKLNIEAIARGTETEVGSELYSRIMQRTSQL